MSNEPRLFQKSCNAFDFIGSLFDLFGFLQAWNFFDFFLDI